FFSNDPATPLTYPLRLHDALPISRAVAQARARRTGPHAPAPALRVPDPEAALRSLHPGDGGAGVRLAQREVHQGRGDAAREFGSSEEHTSELQSLAYLVCRLLLEK